jgi:predicted NodU family carbamoyl transferase
MRILGIYAFYHDSAAALVKDGYIIAAAQEERFTRKKQDARYPENAIRYCLDEGGLTLDDLDWESVKPPGRSAKILLSQRARSMVCTVNSLLRGTAEFHRRTGE